MLTPGQQDKFIKMGLQREPTESELNNQDYANNPGLLADTLWANGGEEIYKESQKPSKYVKVNDLYTKE